MIIVTGAAGQLGTDLVKELEQRGIEHKGIDIAELDITDGAAVDRFFCDIASQRDKFADSRVCLIHCAAYTAVDKAEDESELCFKINAEGTENLAKACRRINAEMLYISTDYVFSGEGETPFETDAHKAPLSTYGKSKYAGEEAVIKHLEEYYIVRISWVFGKNGPNFVKTMLRLAETRDEISVVKDQIGSPTYTPDVSKTLCDIALSGKYGEYHATNEGYCSWAEFAEEIMNLRHSGLDPQSPEKVPVTLGSAPQSPEALRAVKINPITTEEYPTKAVRPKNSRLSKKSLDKAGLTRLPPWQDALRRYLAEL